MRRTVIAAGSLLGTAALLLLAPLTAEAAPVGSFRITESIDFNTPDGQPPDTTFTSDLPDCASGVFSDEVIHASHDGNFVIDTEYVCAGGSILAKKEVHLGRAGDIEIVGGTGAFAGIRGHGKDVPGPDATDGIATATVSLALFG